MPISRSDFENISESEDLPTRILNFLRENQDNAFEFQELLNHFQGNEIILRATLQQLIVDGKIESKTQDEKEYYIYHKSLDGIAEI